MALKKGNIVQIKTAQVARTNTTAKQLFTLPAQAQIIGVRIYSDTASNAATTATVKVQTRIADGSAAAADLTGAIDVKGANGLQILTGATSLAVANTNLFNRSKTINVLGIYAETGAASNTGGPWTIAVEYL